MRDASSRQILAGLIAALVVGVGMTSLVLKAGRDTMTRAATEQNAVVATAAATESIQRTLAADGDVQATILALVAAVPGLEEIRVIDSGRRQLVASTHAEDREAGEFPRRLEREQKAWYDQAKELASARSTNVMEGKARRDEILKDVTDQGFLEVVLPLLENGEVTGSVQAVNSPVLPADAVGGMPAWLVLVVAVLLLAGLLRLVSGGVPGLATGLVVTVAALWIYASFGVDGIGAVRQAGEQSVADRALDVRVFMQRLPDVEIGSVDIANWNLDRFRVPRDTFDDEGVVATERVDAEFDVGRGRFQQGAILMGILALIFYYWVAAGWASRTGSALMKYRSAYGFVVPAMVGMVFLVFFPFFYGVLLSFTNQTLYNVNQPLYDL